MRILSLFLLGSGAIAVVALACGGSDSDVNNSPPADAGTVEVGPRANEYTGQTCTAPTQCYPHVTEAGVDASSIKGTVTCLTKIPNGYCTHECTADTDCCAVAGECLTGTKQVCSPLENQPAQYCFLSCEEEDMNRAIAANAGSVDGGYYYDGGAVDGSTRENEFCKSYAGTSTECRSSGGGNKNRKVCIPKQ
jgi:hypothetical protein